jgi:hypothetical protein
VNNAIGLSLGEVMTLRKDGQTLTVDLSNAAVNARAGVYYVIINMGKNRVVKKWVKVDR